MGLSSGLCSRATPDRKLDAARAVMSTTAYHKAAFTCGRRLCCARRVHLKAFGNDHEPVKRSLDLPLSRRDAVGQSLAMCLNVAAAPLLIPAESLAAEGKDFVTTSSGLKVLDIRYEFADIVYAVLQAYLQLAW